SRKAEGIVCPILYIASITSSVGILEVTPAKAISAETIAFDAPAAFLFTQGTSTKPATGSHTKPSIFFKQIAKASDDCCGVPPASSTVAPAAIAAAEPTSAWQPPAAPEIDALFATTKPNAPDVSKKFSISFREGSRRGFKPNNTPGTTPADPAVGVAQILPIAAFTSFVATALLTASNNVLPANDLPVFKYSLINTASPPVNPVVEVTPSKPSS